MSVLLRDPSIIDAAEFSIDVPNEGGRDARLGLGLGVKNPACRLAVELVSLRHLSWLFGRDILIRRPPKEHLKYSELARAS